MNTDLFQSASFMWHFGNAYSSRHLRCNCFALLCIRVLTYEAVTSPTLAGHFPSLVADTEQLPRGTDLSTGEGAVVPDNPHAAACSVSLSSPLDQHGKPQLHVRHTALHHLEGIVYCQTLQTARGHLHQSNCPPRLGGAREVLCKKKDIKQPVNRHTVDTVAPTTRMHAGDYCTHTSAINMFAHARY